MKVRIKFAKYGSMKFIGHLDVMRFFQKALCRAGVDMKYSAGFNPHQIMSFAAPLGVGIESTGEYLDIEVNSISSMTEMKNALNQVMVEGIEIISATVLPDSSKNAMASVAAAEYQITCHTDEHPIEEIIEKLDAFYQQEHIPVTKTTKKSVLELDIKPGIYALSVSSDNMPSSYDSGSFVITMLINASSSGNIKPTMVLDAFCSFARISLPPFSYQITRLDTYTNLAKNNETPKFVPLGQASEEEKE